MEFIILAFVAGSFPVGWDWPQTIIPKALRFRPHTFASQKHTHCETTKHAKFHMDISHDIKTTSGYICNSSQSEKKIQVF